LFTPPPPLLLLLLLMKMMMILTLKMMTKVKMTTALPSNPDATTDDETCLQRTDN